MELQNGYHYGIGTSKIREEAIALHRMRYYEVGFFTENEEDPYEKDSVYFVAQEASSQQVVGVSRLIFKTMDHLPTIENFDIYDLDYAKLLKLEKHRYAEMSAFTKLPKHEVGIEIIRTIFQYSNQTGLTHWICCIDERVFKYLNRIFSSIFKEIGVPKVYLGSISIPCMVNLPEAMKEIKIKRPKLYDFLSETEQKVQEVSK